MRLQARSEACQNARTPEACHISNHAQKRMDMRRISWAAVQAVLRYGRRAHACGALFFAIGRKEVMRYRARGIDLSAYRNIQVVCSPDGVILTTYRSSDFRPLKRHA